MKVIPINNAILSAMVGGLIFVELVDLYLNRTYLIHRSSLSFGNDLVAFVVLQLIFITLQMLLFRFVSQNVMKTNRKSLMSRIITVIVLLSQLSLVSIIMGIIIQMGLYQSYDLMLLVITLWISYLLAISMLAILSYRFFLWLRFHKSLLITSYGIAASTLALNLILTLMLVSSLLIGQPIVQKQVLGSEIVSISSRTNLVGLFNILTIISFVAAWFATILILRHYSSDIGVTKFWIVTSLPLAYFIIQFQPILFDVFSRYTFFDPATTIIVYSVLLTASKPLGGALFCAAFYTVGRSIGDPLLKRDMYISGCGILLLFSSNQALFLSSTPYPPFGLLSVASVGLASYLLLFGISRAALAVSEDAGLRRTVRKSLIDRADLLDTIGTAEMKKTVETQVMRMLKDRSEIIEVKTGFEFDLDIERARRYVDEAIAEVKGKQSGSRKT